MNNCNQLNAVQFKLTSLTQIKHCLTTRSVKKICSKLTVEEGRTLVFLPVTIISLSLRHFTLHKLA